MLLLQSTTALLCRLSALAILFVFSTRAADVKLTSNVSPETGDQVFTSRPLLRLQIEIPEKEMALLRKFRWTGRGGGEQKRETVNGTVREGDRVYTNVAIHLKGAAGSFRPVDANPGLTLNFGKNAKGQTFRGLQRLSLNNSVQDPSFLSEQLSREIFAAAGVPVPRATQVTVELNGRDLGIYVLTEAFNKQFLARHFENPNGNLYDGGFLKDVDDDLEKSSGKNPQDRSDLKRLAEAAKEPNLINRFTRLTQILDVDRFITQLALDVLLCNWDGYGINKNNYRVYHDPSSDKIVFMPHGLDQMFGVMRTGPDMPIFPRMSGLVAKAVLQTPTGQARYRRRLSQLMTEIYQVEKLTNRVQQLAEPVRATLSAKKPASVKSYDREVAALSDRIAHRAQNIRDQMSESGKTVVFGADGTVRLADWKARADSGKPVVNQTNDASGKMMLHIRAGSGSSVGVWSTKVRLDPGFYRFEGKVKGLGVVPDAGDRKGGVWLRTADRRLTQKLVGENTWIPMGFDLKVEQNLESAGFMGRIESAFPEIELVCELRAARGEAWFDLDSLRLVKKQ